MDIFPETQWRLGETSIEWNDSKLCVQQQRSAQHMSGGLGKDTQYHESDGNER